MTNILSIERTQVMTLTSLFGPNASTSFSPVKVQELIKQDHARLEPRLVAPVSETERRDHVGDTRDLRSSELAVLHVDVVDDLGKGLDSWFANQKALDQYLERALVTLVRELGFEHIEGNLAVFQPVSLASDEFERSLRIDESPDEPSARNAIDVNVLPRDPRSTSVLSRLRGDRFAFRVRF